MMGLKERAFAPFVAVSLEELVPQDHFYRHLQRILDLSFVHDLVREFYASAGRPSIEAMAMIPPNREKEDFPRHDLLKSGRAWVAVASLLSYGAIRAFFASLSNWFTSVIIVSFTSHLDVCSRCSIHFCLFSLLSSFSKGFFDWQAQVLS